MKQMTDEELMNCSKADRDAYTKALWDSFSKYMQEAFERTVDELFEKTCKEASDHGVSCSSCGINLSTRSGKVKIMSALRQHME